MAIIFITLVIAFWSFTQQIILGIPFGNNPAPDGTLVLLMFAPIILFGFVLSLTLHTRIDRHSIVYRFAPIHRKERLIKWEAVKKIYVRKYKPIAEYGGWGFRLGRSGRAFNTSGNMGLQLVLNDGKKILIGTQEPEELKRIIGKLETAKVLN